MSAELLKALTEQRAGYAQQLEKQSKELQALDQRARQISQVSEQLKGAVFALDETIAKLNKASEKQENKEAQASEQAGN